MRAIALRVAPHRPCALDASVSDSLIAVGPARARSRGQRRALLAGTMLGGAVLFAALAVPAFADGGAGGGGGGSLAVGGTGGTTNTTTAGGTGGVGTVAGGDGGGGGGGGAGSTGGDGGAGTNTGGGSAAGGTGGSSAGASGSNGGDSLGGASAGAAGGGGGAHGEIVTTTTTDAGALGGNGGKGGGVASPGSDGSGGGGGAGGYGVVVNGSSLTYTNTGTVRGGTGGAGGNAGSTCPSCGGGGSGGAGGIGVDFLSGGTLNNSGIIAGGNGGAGGTASAAGGGVNGSAGAGGAGIVGSGLTVINSGTVTGGLSGDGVTRANAITFTGGTNTLELRFGSSITGNVIAFSTADTLALGGTTNASFDVSQIGATAQYQGFGIFQKTGTSTWTLTGTTSTVTSWAINGGTLAVSSDSNLGNGSGTLSFGGGTLQFLSGFTTSRAVTLNAGGGTFDTNGNNATLSGVISGTGGLTKIGAGALTLSGNSSYSGATAVNAGTLFVNGSIANSAVMVNSGATLAGTGTVGATTINSGGIFAPGTSPGTITVQGNLAFQSGALYLVQVNPSTASSTNVTSGGTASLAGTVQAAFASGSYASRAYTILSAAGGLNGTTFNTLTTSNLPAGFTASLSYTATDAILNLTAILAQIAQPSGPSGPSALSCGFSVNQCNVANALNAFFNNGGTLPPNFVTIFGLTGANLANALTLLSGEAATGGQQVAFQLTNQFLNVMLDPFVDGRSNPLGGSAIGFAPEREELPDDLALAYAKILKEPPKPPSFDQRWSVWGAGYGGSNRTTGDPAVIGSHDLSARTAGGTAGLDYRLAPGTVVGFALAGGGTSWGLAQGLGGGKSDAFQAGVYGATRWGPAYLTAALAYTNHWMSTDRFAFAGDHLSASFNAQSFGGRVESGYRFATIYGGLTPYAAIQAQSFHTPSYNESDLNAGGFGLAFNSRNATDTRSELGARFDRLLLLNPEAALTLRARVAWAHDWVSDPSLVPLFQALPGASFVVNGATLAKNSALTSAGVEYRLANGVTLLAKFDGEFASHSSTYAGTGTVRYTW